MDDEIPVEIKRSRRARRLALRLDSKDRLFRLTIPYRFSERKAWRFVEEHRDWMAGRMAELPPAIYLEHGAVIPLLGQETRIHVDIDSHKKRTDIQLTNGLLYVSTNKDDPSSRILRFLKTLAKEKLSALSHDKVEKIGKTISSVTVRDTKSRWGSCSADGSLSYSWRLILAPTASMDYVVAHEVAHLKHLDHSKAFWALNRELADNFIEGQYWIRNNGAELMRYGLRAS